MDADELDMKLEQIKDSIFKASGKSGRKPRILFATKYADHEAISILADIECDAGGRLLIGENRVQDWEKKLAWLRANRSYVIQQIEAHMIGHLQSNKAKKAVELFDCIQSVDSLKIAEKISEAAKSIGKEMPVYLEVNISGEQSKFGFEPKDVPSAFIEISRMKNLKVVGLMGMAPHTTEPEKARPHFRRLRQLADSLKLSTSMGMSNDFLVAVEEGSDMVRVGSAVFGEIHLKI
jgi:pyridoxal phosphate enzyme (YggS family)